MITEIDAMPDWLTCTTKTVLDTQFLRHHSLMYVDGEPGGRPWRFRDYAGRRRHDAQGRGGVAYAEKHAGTFGVMQSWGELAHRMGLALKSRKLRATRVDLQVTVLHDEPQPTVYEMLPTLPIQKAKYTGVCPLNEEGGTLYIGSRSSDAFGRLYDKGAQLPTDIPPRVLWRYEVEYKRSQAQAVAEEVWYDNIGVHGMRDYIVARVEQFFLSHEIPVPFQQSHAQLSSLVRYATRIQDNERTIKWLTEQVSPAIRRVIDNGRYVDVCIALGAGVRDGLPVFEVNDIIPGDQYLLWPGFDNDTESR